MQARRANAQTPRTRQSLTRQARFARVRLFALLALLLPLFSVLQTLAEAGVPRVEVRIVSRDVTVEVPVEVVIERFVDRLVYVPVPTVALRPWRLPRWDITGLPQAGAPLFRAAQATARAAGMTVLPQGAAGPIFGPGATIASRIGGPTTSGSRILTPGSILGDQLTVAVGPLGLNAQPGVAPAAPPSSVRARGSSGSVFASAPTDAADIQTAPNSGDPVIVPGSLPVAGVAPAVQPELTLATTDPALAASAVGTPRPTMVAGPVRRQPSRQRRSDNDNQSSSLSAMALSDPDSVPVPVPPPSGGQTSPAPAPPAPPPPPPDNAPANPPTKTPTPVPPNPPTATPKPPVERPKPATPDVPPTATPRAAPTKTPTPKPNAAPTKTPTPKPNAAPTKTPTPKPATATPKPAATKTPTPKLAATKTPTPKPVVRKTPTPKPAATKTPTPKPKPQTAPTKAPTPKPKAKNK